METKFTPGPWRYIDATQEASMRFAPSCVIKGGNKQIANFSWNDRSPWFPAREESQANARLIAAAPELLAALARLLSSYQRVKPPHSPLSDAEREAMAAVAKATGEQS